MSDAERMDEYTLASSIHPSRYDVSIKPMRKYSADKLFAVPAAAICVEYVASTPFMKRRTFLSPTLSNVIAMWVQTPTGITSLEHVFASVVAALT